MKIVIEAFPDIRLIRDPLQQILGSGFKSASLHLKCSLPHRSNEMHKSVFMHTEGSSIFQMSDHRCRFKDQERIEAFGYRLVVLPVERYRIPDQFSFARPALHWNESIQSIGGNIRSFEVGKGAYLENLLDAHPELRTRLDEIAASQQRISDDQFCLRYDDTSDLLIVELNQKAEVRTWTIDTNSWDLTESLEREDWLTNRLSNALENPFKFGNALLRLIGEIHLNIHRKGMIFSNVASGCRDGNPDTAILNILEFEINELLKLLLLLEKYVRNPLDEVISKPKYNKLIEKLSTIKSLGQPRQFNIHDTLKKLPHTIDRGLLLFKSGISGQSGSLATPLTDISIEVWIGNCCELVWDLHQLTEGLLRDEKIALSLSRRVRKLVDISGLRNHDTPSQLPFKVKAISKLHKDITEFVAVALKPRLSGFSQPLLILDPEYRLSPVSNLDAYYVIWAAGWATGDLLAHVRSRTDTKQGCLLLIRKNKPIAWSPAPFVWSEPSCINLRFECWRWVTAHSIWIVQVINEGSQGMQHVSRLSVTGPVEKPCIIRQVTMSIMYFGLLKNCLIVLDQFLLFASEIVSSTTVFDTLELNLVGVTEGANDLDFPITLHYCKAQKIEQQMRPGFNHTFDSSTANISSTTDQTIFVSLLHGAPMEDQQIKRSRSIGLAVYKLMLQTKSYKLIRFESWSLQIGFPIPLESETKQYTFKSGRSEFFLCSMRRSHILISFAPDRLHLVWVNGNPVFEFHESLGQPIDFFGFKAQSPSFVYRRKCHTELRFIMRLLKVRFANN